MRNNTKSVFAIFFLCILWNSLVAFASVEPAASISEKEQSEAGAQAHPVIRPLDPLAMEELRSDAAMDYKLSSPDNNFWLMFRDWVSRQLLHLLGSPEAVDNIEILVYALGLLGIAYAILRILKADTSGLFGRKAGRQPLLYQEAEENHENIHEIDFGRALAEALKSNEFNKAIRLLYLSALKELTKREHIQWQPGKTNYQYQQELKAAPLQSPFSQLGFFFEHAWYGNFHISEQHFKEAERSYQALQQNLQQLA